MRKGIATPETNLKKSLTIPVKTRSPLEAFQMLRAGQPVDQALAYYVDQNGEDKDLFLMDKVEKLHAISRFKTMAENAKMVYQSDLAEYNNQQAEVKKAAEEAAKQQRDQIISQYIKDQKNESSTQTQPTA